MNNSNKNEGIQINKKKCWKCSKKIGLSAIMCRCNYTFCNIHRYPEEHQCSFDYRKFDAQILSKQLVKINIPKFTKI